MSRFSILKTSTVWAGGLVAVVLALGGLAGCPEQAPPDSKPMTGDPAVANVPLSSPDFGNEQKLPEKDTAESPALEWSDLPPKTRELAVVMEDIDAPQPFYHWIAYKIPATLKGLPAGGRTAVRIRTGTNSNGQIAYFGPQPPSGKRHRFTFTLYALDTLLDLDEGATQAQLQDAMKHHVIGRGRLVGVYTSR